MGKYSGIWKQLKATGQCAIAAPKSLHPRLIRAVRDAKFKDVGYRLEKAEAKIRPIITRKIEQSRITFFLREYSALEELEEFDL